MSYLTGCDLSMTQKQLVSFLRGVKDGPERIKNTTDSELLEFKGSLKSCDAAALSRLIRLMVVQGIMTENLRAFPTGKGKGERICSYSDITRKGMSFLNEIKRKIAKQEELDKFKIAVVDYSRNNNINVNSDNEERFGRNRDFDDLIENAVAESEQNIEAEENKKKVKKKRKNNKPKNDNDTDASEVELQKVVKKYTNKKNNKKEKENKTENSDCDQLSNNVKTKFYNINNINNNFNINEIAGNNFGYLNGIVSENEEEYVLSQFEKFGENKQPNYNINDNKQIKNTITKSENANQNNNDNTINNNSISDSILYFINNIDNFKEEMDIAINNNNKNYNNLNANSNSNNFNNINTSNKSNNNINENNRLKKTIIDLSQKITNDLEIGKSSNSPEEDEDGGESDFSDNNIANNRQKKLPKKVPAKASAQLQKYPQQLFMQEEDYGEFLSKQQFEDLFEKLKSIRLSLFKRFNRKIPENLAENEVDLNDLDLDVTEAKIGLEDIFPNTGLKELCRKIPTTEEELDNNYIYGVGVQCLKKYGVYFLDEIKLFLEKNYVRKDKINFKEKFESQKISNQKNSEYTGKINELRQSTVKKENKKKLQQAQQLSFSNRLNEILVESPSQSKLNDYFLLPQSGSRIKKINDVVIKSSSSNNIKSGSKGKKESLLPKKIQDAKIYKKENDNFTNDTGSGKKQQLDLKSFYNINSNMNVNVNNNNNNINNNKVFVYEHMENYNFLPSDDPGYEEQLKALDSKINQLQESKEINLDNINEFNSAADNANAESNHYFNNRSSNKNQNISFGNNAVNSNFNHNPFISNNKTNSNQNMINSTTNTNKIPNIRRSIINNENLNNNINQNFNVSNFNYFIRNNNYNDLGEIDNQKDDSNDPVVQNILQYNDFENDCLMESVKYFADEDEKEEDFEPKPMMKNNKVTVSEQETVDLQVIEEMKKLVNKSKKHKRGDDWDDDDSEKEKEKEKKLKRNAYFQSRAWRGRFKKK